MAEIPSIYKNVKNWKVEDNIYLSIVNTENISNMHEISHVIISLANFWHIYDIAWLPDFGYFKT